MAAWVATLVDILWHFPWNPRKCTVYHKDNSPPKATNLVQFIASAAIDMASEDADFLRDQGKHILNALFKHADILAAYSSSKTIN